eukprot:scaffold956_cov533-Prasinococcus_capsulatus_cf.AAC.3
MNCDCISVGKPGYGKVVISTGDSTSDGTILRTSGLSTMTWHPVSCSFAVTAVRCWGHTGPIESIELVIAPATKKVPASMRSGIILYSTPRSSLTPSMVIVLVPAPRTLPFSRCQPHQHHSSKHD